MSDRPCVSRYLAMCFVILLASAGTFSVAAAGTICGTVRDADTLLPVPQAAIFLYDNTNTYTGIHTATNASGAYCLENVQPATYTIEVRRDGYVTVVVSDIEVLDTSTGVDVVTYPK